MLRRFPAPGATLIALHASAAAPATALCAALDMPAGGAPEWVHLLPAGEIRTGDGRGPYRVADTTALLSASLRPGDRLPIDENHATDLAAPRGEPAPARGWIVDLQARADGVWGRVEWTEDGRRLVEGRAYRGVSPVIVHQLDNTVTALLRASLVNKPNLRGLTALHAEDDTMTLHARLAALFGLPAACTEDHLVTHVTTMHAAQAASTTALQAALDPIARAVGLQAGADAAAVLAGVEQKAVAGGEAATVTALQQELAAVTTRLNTIVEDGKRNAAVAFVDGAIKAQRVGIKPLRDRYVAMHMADAAGTETLINAMPVLGAGGAVAMPNPPAADGTVALNAEQLTVARMLGQDATAYADTLKAERALEAAL